MHSLYVAWTSQPYLVKLGLLGQLWYLVLSIRRLARLRRNLRGKIGKAHDVVPGALGAGELLALDAIAGRPQLPEPTGAEQPHVDLVLQSADLFLSYICDRSHSDLVAARRAGILILLIAFTICACGAYPTFNYCFNNSGRTGWYCRFITGEWVLNMLYLGLLPCVAIYAVSNYFDSQLAERKARWTYLSAKWRQSDPTP